MCQSPYVYQQVLSEEGERYIGEQFRILKMITTTKWSFLVGKRKNLNVCYSVLCFSTPVLTRVK